MDVVVVGSCMIDFSSYAPHLPQAGETVVGQKFATGFGGKGANQCVAAAKLGARTALIARLGDDYWAEKYVECLRLSIVDIACIQRTENCSSGIAQIVVSDSGENQIVIVQGANQFLCVSDVENARDKIQHCKVVICQLETSPEVAIKALQICTGKSILNGAPALKACNSLLFTLPYIFCVNETEASIFSGLPVSQAEEALIALRQKGCRNIIITLGSQGALLLPEGKMEWNKIDSPCVKCVDSTGAGDAFIGALGYLLASRCQSELVDLVRIACAIAAHSVTKQGTQVSFPDQHFFAKHFQ